MFNKVRWGALSTANIGHKKVLPAMQQGEYTTVAAIASRDLAKAREAATSLGIPTAYGSYEELLADPNVDAIYNPLPNHLHVPWTIQAAEAGKHVLCEKPLSLTVAEAKTLLAVRARTGVKIGEAFMVDCHPQWIRLRQLLGEGRIGELRSIAGFFSYFNINPANIRNQIECGGGALMDIGCYLVHVSRYAFAEEPTRVVALIDRDPAMHTDRLTSAILDFPGGQAIFTCSTQLVPYQRIQFLGTRGRIEIEIPVNAPPDRPTRIFIDDGKDLSAAVSRRRPFPSAISTPYRATHSPRLSWTTRKSPFPSKKPSKTWLSSRPSSTPPRAVNGSLPGNEQLCTTSCAGGVCNAPCVIAVYSSGYARYYRRKHQPEESVAGTGGRHGQCLRGRLIQRSHRRDGSRVQICRAGNWKCLAMRDDHDFSHLQCHHRTGNSLKHFNHSQDGLC